MVCVALILASTSEGQSVSTPDVPASVVPPAVAVGNTPGNPPDAPALPPVSLTLLAALEATLRHDPNIALAENQVQSSRGTLLVARSRFDPILSSTVFEDDSIQPTIDGGSSQVSTLTTSVDVEGELRTGLQWSPSVQVQRVDGVGVPDSTSTVAFTLRQPLLRNRGRVVVTADEQASRRELAADRWDLEHRVGQRLQSVARQYWTVKAAALDLTVLQEAETRSRELLDTTRRLIASDVTPAAEMVQLEADVTFREAARMAGERVLFQARQDLGREIGLTPPEISALGVLSDPFPRLDPDRVSAAYEAWIATALARRADLRADRERLTAAQLRLTAADNALLPVLDLVFTPSYAGRSDGTGADGTFSALFDNVPGLSTSLGLSLRWPVRNQRAAGALIQSEAAVTSVALTVELGAKAIGAAVPAALDGVRQRARELAKFTAAVAFFERALENEIKKLRAGSSTLIDVLSQRDRLTSVRRTAITARLGLALAIAEVRFQTGTLVTSDPTSETGTGSVSAEHLTTLPDLSSFERSTTTSPD